MSIERIECGLAKGHAALVSAVMRYGVLERLSATSERAGVELLAFGLGDGKLRMLVQGEAGGIANTLRGLKVGTSRAARELGETLRWSGNDRWPVTELDLQAAVAWVHAAPVEAGAVGPLASPWSSHRDLMGYRHAPFYDAGVLEGRVDPQEVHRLAGGHGLPELDEDLPAHASLSILLRVAAAVRGVLPADRRCFRLFAHLAARMGWKTVDIAHALALTNRRVRQLKAAEEPLVPTALITLCDPKLGRVP